MIARLSAGVAIAALVALGGYGSTTLSPVSVASAADAPVAGSGAGHIDNFTLSDQNSAAHELYKMSGASAIVLITQMNGCPIVRNITPAIRTLQDKYKGKGVEFMMLNSSLADSREDVAAEAKDFGINMPILLDKDQHVGEKLGIIRTAEVIVVNPKTWQIIYRGPIDDRVTYERQRAQADHRWADDAISAAIAGKTVDVAKRDVEGCIINFPNRTAKT